MEKKMKRLGWKIFATDALLGASSVIPLTYVYYCFTDIGKIDAGMITIAMLTVNIASFIWSFFSGALIQRTRSKNGMYRPWLFGGTVMLLVGTLMMIYSGESMLVTTIIIASGYLLVTFMMDSQCTGKYGVFEKMSQGNSEARNLINGRSYAGVNFAYIIYSYLFLYAVAFFGGDNEVVGFRYVQLILCVMTMIGLLFMMRISKPYDTDNRLEKTEHEQKVSILLMFKSVLANRCMVGLFIGDVIRFAGFFVFSFMLIYQCESVLKNIYLYATATALSALVGVIASLVAPKVIEILGGRKRATSIMMFLTGACFIVMAFTGQTMLGLMIPYFLATFFQFISDSVNILLYLDAGEIWYSKTGKDTRAYSMSMSNLVAKIANIFTTMVVGWTLVRIGYAEGIALSAVGKTTLTMVIGILPGVGAIIYSLLLIVVHNVSDKEVKKMIEKNAKKDGFSMYDEA